LARTAGLAGAYFLAGKLALLLAVPPGYAAPVGPAAGIALAGLLLMGPGAGPGIFLGSFLVNIGTSFDTTGMATMVKPTLLTAGIATVATLQALLGAFLIRRLVGYPTPLDRTQDFFKSMALGGPINCLVGASAGVACLWAAGAVPPGEGVTNWWTWWLGDTIGVLIVLPLASVWNIELHQQRMRTRLSVILPLCVAITKALGAATEAIDQSLQERTRSMLEEIRAADTDR
jgi:integral membrane sensor domain MASE1